MKQRLDSALGLFRRLLGVSDAARTADSELLESFVQRRDEKSFEELVRRHDPMVLGVCRRVLRDTHATDDAFQVTFLTLACKAAGLRRGQALPAWLHRVAFHVALRVKARARRASEIDQEVTPMSVTDPATEAAWRELSAVLDEELQRLPDNLRGPLVLCGLEGKTHEEAARELGWPAGSLSKRLARGRELLRQRLARRGFALGSAAATAGLIGEATAAVPPALLSQTIGGALAVVTGQMSQLSAATAALLREVLNAMFWTRFKLGVLVLLALALIGPGIGLGLAALNRETPLPEIRAQRPPQEDAQPKPAEPPPDLPARKEEPPPVVEAPGTGKLVAILGAKKFRFNSAMIRVAYSPDGKLLAVSDHNAIHLYDAATKQDQRTWYDEPKGLGIRALSFSPDSKLLAVADRSPTVRLWEVATGKLHLEFAAHRSGVYSILFSPDGKRLATTGHDRDRNRTDLLADNEFSVRVWDAQTGKESAAFTPAILGENCVAFSPNSKLLAWAGINGKVHVCTVIGGEDVFTHAEKVEPGRFPITALDFSTDGKILAVGTEGVIKLYDVFGGKLLRTLAHEPKDGQAIPDGWRLHFSPDGKTLGSIGALGIALWDVESGKLKAALHGKSGQPGDLAFYPDGKSLVNTATDQSIQFWDTVTGKQESEEGHHGPVHAVVSPDGKLVVTGSDRENLRFWDRRTGKELPDMPKWPNGAIAFVPDGLQLITRSVEGELSIRYLDPATGKEKARVAKVLPSGMCMAVSADGKLLAVGQQKIVVYELPSAKEKLTLDGHGSYCAHIAFGPDGKTLVSGGQDTIMPEQTYGVKLWDLNTGKELRRLPHDKLYAVNRVFYSPDGRYIVTNLRMYDFGPPPIADLATAKITDVPALGASISYPGNPMAFSADSKLLAIGLESRQLSNKISIEVWDTTKWEKLAVLEGHTQRILSLAFTADGKFLISGSMDSSARVWDIPERKK